MRKEALEALEKLVANPKIEGGQYGELLGALKKVSTNQKQDVSRSADAHVHTNTFTLYDHLWVTRLWDHILWHLCINNNFVL